MVFNVSNVLVALVAITAVSASTILEKRQANPVTCDYVLKPDVTVTPTDAEFNFGMLARSPHNHVVNLTHVLQLLSDRPCSFH